MYDVKRQYVIVIVTAFVMILVLSIMYCRTNPHPALYIAYVLVSLAVANLLALLAVRLHRLESESVIDPLTDSFNRRYFEKRIQQETKRANRVRRPLSALFIDIDDFKAYNDRYGHTAGDQALKRVVTVISHCIRAMDVIARYGGEEFVALLPEADIDSAAAVAERIRQTVSASFCQDGKSQNELTVTIGVATHRYGEESLAVIHRADQAMYAGKARGKNQTAVDSEDAKGSVLVVEDDASVREVCARALLKAGYDVESVASGDAALHALEHRWYHLVICDTHMPGVNGLAVLKALRERQPRLPAICISGHLPDATRAALDTMGHIFYLPKPFRVADLLERASTLISSSPQTTPPVQSDAKEAPIAPEETQQETV